MNNTTKKITYSGVLLALCILLPFLTFQQQQLGNMFSLIHIPVLLCGFVCGWQYGLIVGLMAPLLRHFFVGMPPFDAAVLMTIELAAYGAFAGVLYKSMPKKNVSIYVTLILSMILGRLAYGAAGFAFAKLLNIDFTIALFITKAFVNAVPGIICHIIVIPLIVIGLRKAKMMPDE